MTSIKGKSYSNINWRYSPLNHFSHFREIHTALVHTNTSTTILNFETPGQQFYFLAQLNFFSQKGRQRVCVCVKYNIH